MDQYRIQYCIFFGNPGWIEVRDEDGEIVHRCCRPVTQPCVVKGRSKKEIRKEPCPPGITKPPTA